MKLNDRGLLIVLSGPSGVGKGTVRSALFKMEGHDLVFSVSMTTRKPRIGEIDGKDYFFISKEKFEANIRDRKMLEYAEFVGNYYGTPLDTLERYLEDGREVVLEIDVQGAEQVRESMPDAVFIFIAPPSLEALANRLQIRGTEPVDVIKQRIEKARREIKLAYKYDYIVVNDSVENAADKILAIIRAEHATVKRTYESYKKLIGVNE